jgi:hypothetical protein
VVSMAIDRKGLGFNGPSFVFEAILGLMIAAPALA